MKYNVDYVKENKDKDFISFWGVKDHKDKYRFLSNFYPCQIEVTHFDSKQVKKFKSSEQLFMYKKAILFEDFKVADTIFKVNKDSPQFYKNQGRKVKGFDEDTWNENKYDLMKATLYEKFSQNTYLKKWLLNTGNSILVETSPFDRIWGIGLKNTDSGWKNVDRWKGENLLGFCLMEVRDDLNKL